MVEIFLQLPSGVTGESATSTTADSVIVAQTEPITPLVEQPHPPLLETLPRVTQKILVPCTDMNFDYFQNSEWEVAQGNGKSKNKDRLYLHDLVDATGGLSLVYRATDRLTGETYAIKELKSEYTANQDIVKKFREEAAVHLMLRHKNIVPAYDYFEYQGRYFLVLSFVHSPTIKDHLEKSGPLSSSENVTVINQLIDASEYCLQHNVINTDIKPANVFFDKTSGLTLLSDFGIVVNLKNQENADNGMAGTLQHMTPEQMKGLPIGEDAVPYYLGVLSFEMATGVKMLEHRTPEGDLDIVRTVQTIDNRTTDPGRMVLLQKTLLKENIDFIPVDERDLWVCHDDEDFLRENLHPFIFMLFKATRKDVDRRYQTIQEFKPDFVRGSEALKVPWAPPKRKLIKIS